MGVPPLNEDGGSASLDLQLLLAFQWASELEKNLGNPGLSQEYEQKAKQLKTSIQSKYWDAQNGMYADADNKNNFSLQANSLAILAGMVSGEEACKVFVKADTDNKTAKPSIYFQYYVNQALYKVGLGDEYLNRLNIWKEFIKQGGDHVW